MGFHGIADCPEGPQTPCRCHDSVDCNRDDGHHSPPGRSIVSHHRNNGPVDLSKFHTYVPSRGTWSIGGQRTVTQPPPQMSMQAPSSQLINSTWPNSTTASTSANQPGAASSENNAPIKPTRLSRSTLDVDAPESLPKSEDTKDGRSNSDAERIEYERKHAVLLEKVRATGFPLNPQ